ncbi:MAG: transglutaminase domain-containing protein, partial [Planctomycetota bacterium]
DFQEIHKYLTDPARKDTDGDGAADGDWNERREYAYTIRTILQYLPPYDDAVLNDDFQDARLLEKADDCVEVEVIHYPLSTAPESIKPNPNWQEDYSKMTEYLKPRPAANWNEQMRKDLLAELKADGIVIDKLDDEQVVKKVAAWLMRRSRYLGKVFTTFYVHFPEGTPAVYPGLEKAFEAEFKRDCKNYNWTIDEHLEHELLGKGMFYNKTHGSCTSFSVYLTTALRALGIPTRIVMACPAVDASDQRQLQMVQDRITHNQARHIMMEGLSRSRSGFTNHTFNEVYVGNRWHRLNYSRLGQPVLDPHLFGLHTHLYTVNDLSEVDLAASWGRRYAKGLRSTYFKHSNPYSAITISDRFGAYANIPNPPFVKARPSVNAKPDIFIMEPHRESDSQFSVWDEVFPMVKSWTRNKTGRTHSDEHYEYIFNGPWAVERGDVIVLVFSLDSEGRISKAYEDLLPKRWPEIEAELKQGRTVEIIGRARGCHVILFAASKREQLRPLIRKSKLLESARKLRE